MRVAGVSGFGPGRCCSPRHGMPFKSRHRDATCVSRRMRKEEQEQEEEEREEEEEEEEEDDVAGNICRALPAGRA